MYSGVAENVQADCKSPISILQELMMKEMNLLPNYTLVYDGSGSHLPSFTIRVECKGSSAEATASSKKEAKHKAAQAMLNLLSKDLVSKKPESMVPTNLIKHVNSTTPEVPSVNSTVNSVGKLQELCVQNRLDEPLYEIINVSGPSHAPTFTLICTVQMLQEEASGRSKKQAKQDVAQKMLNRLKDDTNLPESLKLKIVRVNDEDIKDISKGMEFMDLSVTNLKKSKEEQINIAKARYVNLTKQSGIVDCKTYNIPISMYHQCIKIRHINLIETLTCLINRTQSYNIPYNELRVNLEMSSNILNCETKEISYKLNKENLYVVGIQLSFTPHIMEIGYSITEKEAEKSAMIAVMETLLLLLK